MSAMVACRVTVTRELLEDDDLWASHKLRRHVIGELWTVPAGVRVFVDLGPTRYLDHQLVAELAERPCAGMVVFESSNWRLAKEYADGLNAALAKRVAG